MVETAVPTHGSDQLKKPHTARSADKVAACREVRTWKRLVYAGAAIAIGTLTLALSVYDRLTAAGDGTHQGWKPNVPLRDPHGDARRDRNSEPAHDKERGLRLRSYRSEAEAALRWAMFYECDGATDNLGKCLEVLKRWKQEEIAIHGEPRFTDADGLVIGRSSGETLEQDFWDRVTNAIRQLSQQLD
jgi:hypothetical protein